MGIVKHPRPTKLTVLIATFNSETVVHRALESVISQRTTFDFEILVHDDASTDQTRTVVEGILGNQPLPWRLIQAPQNLVSQSKSPLLACLDLIETPLVARLDHDDFWLSDDKLERQVELLMRYPDSVLCCTGWQIEDTNGRILDVPNIPGFGEEVDSLELARGNFICHSSVVYRVEALRGLPSVWAHAPLRDFTTWALISEGRSILVDRRVSTSYVSSPDSSWMSQPLIARLLDELHSVIWLSATLTSPESRARYRSRAKELKDYWGQRLLILAPEHGSKWKVLASFLVGKTLT